MNRNVWTYWEGKKPSYIALCHEIAAEYCSDLIILTPENAQEYIGNLLHENWKKLECPAHRADAVRVATICKNGGLYVDADTLFLKSLDSFYDTFKNSNSHLIFTRWDDGRVLNGYFYGRENTSILDEWLFMVNKKLVNRSPIMWTSLGEGILTPLIYGKHSSCCTEMSRDIFLPINIDRIPQVFFENVDYRAFVKGNTVAVGLNNSWFIDNYPDFVDNWTDERFSDTLIQNMIFNVRDIMIPSNIKQLEGLAA